MNDESINEPKDAACTSASSPPSEEKKSGADKAWGQRGLTRKGWVALPHFMTRNLVALGMAPAEFVLVMALMGHKGDTNPWLSNATVARYLGMTVRGAQKVIARCDGRWFRKVSRETEDGRDLANMFDLTLLFDKLEAFMKDQKSKPAAVPNPKERAAPATTATSDGQAVAPDLKKDPRPSTAEVEKASHSTEAPAPAPAQRTAALTGFGKASNAPAGDDLHVAEDPEVEARADTQAQAAWVLENLERLAARALAQYERWNLPGHLALTDAREQAQHDGPSEEEGEATALDQAEAEAIERREYEDYMVTHGPVLAVLGIIRNFDWEKYCPEFEGER